MAANYIVMRIACKADGSTSCPVSPFEEAVPAVKEFYRLCGAAVDSVHPQDTIVILNTRGELMDSKCFMHDQEETNEE